MSSYRKQIKDAIQAQLIAAATPAGSNVLTKLDRPIDPEHDLPAIVVYTMAARRGPQDYGNNLIPRTVTIAIEAAVSSTLASAMEDAENFAAEIEDAVEADPTLGNLVTDTKWRQTISDMSSHGSTVMGVCIVEYDVDIFTNLKPDGAFSFPEMPLDALPTEVIIHADQNAAAYALPEDGPPYPPAELAHLLGQDVVLAPYPPKNRDPLCADGSCEAPAQGGTP